MVGARAPTTPPGRLGAAARPLVGLGLAALLACRGGAPARGVSQVSDQQVNNDAASAGPLAPSVAILGRSIAAPSAAAPLGKRLSWPATKLTFHFTGTGLTLLFWQGHTTGSPTQLNGWHNHFDLVVDGVSAFDALVLEDGPGAYTVVHDLEAGEHTVVLRKRSESSLAGEVTLLAASLDAGGAWLSPPLPKNRRLEVIGASNEAGFGVHGQDPCVASDVLNNALAAWPTLLADQLGLDLVDAAVSGQGILAWSQPILDDHNQPIPGEVQSFAPMPVVWTRADSEDPNVMWDPHLFVPDAVVFDLGPNDYDRGLVVSDDDRAQFVAQYAQFVAQVATAYDQPATYLLLNPLQDANRRLAFGPDLDKVAAQAQSLGAQRVSVLTLPVYTGTTFGCAGHPDLALQTVIASQIGARLAQDLGWQN